MKRRSNNFQRGFTLIELSVVIIILGLLSAAFLNVYKSYIKQKELTVTAENIQAVQDMLRAYRDKNGYYPCPADPQDMSGKATNCALPASGGIKVATGAAGQEVRIGVVPILDLSGETKLIQKAQASDGWKSRLTYAVTTNLAIDALTYIGSTGGITVVNAAGAVQSQNVGIIVLSHGDDGDGAYTLSNGQARTCSAGKKDTENCNGDAVFMSDLRSYGMNGDYTDDYLDYDTATPRTLLGPCTLFWNMNNGDRGSSPSGSGNPYAGSAYSGYGYGVAATGAGGTGASNLYLGRMNRPVDYATMYTALFGSGPATGTIYTGTGALPVGATPETFPVDSPDALAKLFEFKAVDPRTEQVVCINTYKAAPSSGGGNGGNSGGGGNERGDGTGNNNGNGGERGDNGANDGGDDGDSDSGSDGGGDGGDGGDGGE